MWKKATSISYQWEAICLLGFFNDSKSSLWCFVAGCTLYHPVQEITELGLTCIPHTQLGLNWDVPSLTSFLAVSLLMWILIICTGLNQAQLPNSLTRQIRKKKSLPDRFSGIARELGQTTNLHPPTPTSTGRWRVKKQGRRKRRKPCEVTSSNVWE